MRVKVSSIFDMPAKMVFDRVQRFDTLENVSKPLIYFKPIEPKEIDNCVSGGSYLTKIFLFKFFYIGKHVINIVKLDKHDGVIVSNETGIVKRWNHTITVEDRGSKSQYTDEIEIESGIFTFFIWLFATIYYRHRHRRWKEMIRKFNKDQKKGR